MDEDRNETVCHCMGVSRGEIIDAIRDQGLTTVEEIGDATGAGTGCGGCQPDIEELLAKVNR
ncbi:MAG: (2Fe-2S)-binding protein [Tannerella sp.]|jgi:NAD(P)H-nitrite reductase large subunit|nr:(2Fe-2S)-binding protein [Tannerella sp.]